MSSCRLHDILYQQQLDADGNQQMCAAACLCMVYRWLGIDCSQSEVWPAISAANQHGRRRGLAHLLGQDALQRGLAALIVQAKAPLALLSSCCQQAIPTIINHRLTLSSTSGHFSVPLDVDGSWVTLHDPLLGPERRIPADELQSMWRPHHARSEIVGGVLVAFSSTFEAKHACSQCRRPIPPRAVCNQCLRSIPLTPAAVLGCVDPMCSGRTWKLIYCPYCDASQTVATETGE